MISDVFKVSHAPPPSATHIHPLNEDHCILVHKYKKFFKNMTLLLKDLQLALGIILLYAFLDIMWWKQVELVHVAVGPLWNVTAKFLITLRNVRTYWKQLDLTVQGLINSKSCFLGCLIRNSWSLIVLRLFKNSFCSFIGGEDAMCNRSVGWGVSHTGALWRCRWVAGMQGCPCSSLTPEMKRGAAVGPGHPQKVILAQNWVPLVQSRLP